VRPLRAHTPHIHWYPRLTHDHWVVLLHNRGPDSRPILTFLLYSTLGPGPLHGLDPGLLTIPASTLHSSHIHMGPCPHLSRPPPHHYGVATFSQPRSTPAPLGGSTNLYSLYSVNVSHSTSTAWLAPKAEATPWEGTPQPPKKDKYSTAPPVVTTALRLAIGHTFTSEYTKWFRKNPHRRETGPALVARRAATQAVPEGPPSPGAPFETPLRPGPAPVATGTATPSGSGRTSQ
jgi:hypothetical protein